MKSISLFALSILLCFCTTKLPAEQPEKAREEIKTGADQTELYLPLLKGKRVAVLANQTSIIAKTHLVDSLQTLGINIVKVFGPEHGFRGNASAGAKVSDEKDERTGIPIISLYGRKSKPSKEDLADVDILIYDLQDVGVRFYTNINALARLMEACEENGKPLIILDRPNPNGYLIDGPVLDMNYKSGIGMFPLPMAHGLTVGEFAMMANGEGWLSGKVKADIQVIPVANYTHDMPYVLPVSPSPNLNTPQSVLLYPSLCMFEGTYINLGRGTYFPFTVLGSPAYKGIYEFTFTPKGIKGMAETPLFMDQVCYGIDLREYDTELLRKSGQINFEWIKELYEASPEKEKFFDSKLSNQMNTIEMQIGRGDFRQQIIEGVPMETIRAGWEPELSAYKEMRLKYLLYK
ncbi:exo-beta-N-acetylmuramidase NamZ family protein [Algoriphagus yeomjeoni]|uniref:exo-beta-N-acetylmuramidase NamZ family protein n=1 Tax=Algoriphagus yeomjeoni TaxID=291403 RepID=UPI003CE4B957